MFRPRPRRMRRRGGDAPPEWGIAMVRIEELCRKDVINIQDGTRLGFAEDVEIDVCDGKVCSLVIYGRAKFFGLFGREQDIVVPWGDIQKIGEDTILVTYEAPFEPPVRHKGLFHL